MTFNETRRRSRGQTRRSIRSGAVVAIATTALLCLLPAVGAAPNAGLASLARDRMAGIDPLPGAIDPLDGQLPEDVAAEPSIAADPAVPGTAVTAFVDGASGGIGVARTTDAGKSWHSGVLPGTAGELIGTSAPAGVTDPVVAWGVDSVAEAPVYVAFLEFTSVADGYGLDVDIAASHDGGVTWRPPATVFDVPAYAVVTPHPDKPWIAVDRGTGPGHRPGRVYAVWAMEPDLAPLATYSDDGGLHWQTPSVVQLGVGGDTATTPPLHGSDFQAVVLKSGALGIVYDTGDSGIPGTTEEYRFVAATAPAPGQPLSFTTPVRIAAAHHQNEADIAGPFDASAAAVDPASGRIYAAWPDNSRTGGLNDIVVASSEDGTSWTTPVAASAGTDGGDHFHPAIAVGRGGSVRVAWRFRALDGGRLGAVVDTYESESSDSGATFSAPRRINRQRTDLSYARNDPGAPFLGDYDQMASAGNFTYMARAEAYCPVELAPCDPPASHQRIWVAVLTD